MQKSKIIASVLIVLFLSNQFFVPLFFSDGLTSVKISKAEKRNIPNGNVLLFSDSEDEAGDVHGLISADLFCYLLFNTEIIPACLNSVIAVNEGNYLNKVSSCKLHIRNCVYRL
ncbi:MAG TPA: hypothetical protein VNZ49_03190 [Bacteroidia bacterium]|nr:hypothetical protein [Bacteroidia bacterium]